MDRLKVYVFVNRMCRQCGICTEGNVQCNCHIKIFYFTRIIKASAFILYPGMQKGCGVSRSDNISTRLQI